jgi:hypothetical protein
MHRLGVAHLLEQRIEVGVVDRPQRHISHGCSPRLVDLDVGLHVKDEPPDGFLRHVEGQGGPGSGISP